MSYWNLKSKLFRTIGSLCVAGLGLAGAAAVAFAISSPQAAHTGKVTPPAVPPNIQVPAGNTAFLVGHAVGTQNYMCLPSGSVFTWTLFTPQATLFSDDNKQVTTHFFSPNPSENGTVRATWQHSKDTSTVWAFATITTTSTNPAFVAAGAIPWLLLTKAGVQNGPTGGDTLAVTTYIQRLNTSGGVAPLAGCSVSTDVGKRMYVPYTADYFFYRAADGN